MSPTEQRKDPALYSLELAGDVTILSLGVSKLSRSAEIGRMGESMRGKIAALPDPRVVIDMSGLEFAVSSFLGELIHLHEKVAEAGGKLAVCGASGSVLEVIRLMKLDTMFGIHADRDAAIAAVRK